MRYAKLIIVPLFLFLANNGLNVFNANDSLIVAATENSSNYLNTEISPEAVKNTLTLTCGQFQLSLISNSITTTTLVEVAEIDEPMIAPWQLNQISKIYQFDIKNKSAYTTSSPVYLHFNYNDDKKYLRRIYYYDKNNNLWRQLPTKDRPEGKYATAAINFSYARLALFSNPAILAEGKATWYKYKGGDFAASPDFPKGSKIKVYALDSFSGKQNSIEVIINDYGPDRKNSPFLVIDLDKTAFNKLAPLAKGVVNVRIEPIFVNNKAGQSFILGDFKAVSRPEIYSQAAVLFKENKSDVLFNKKASSTLPLASLTKLVAVKVFLDTRPTLNKAVAYSVNDELYNYKYVDHKWQSASLKVKDGDILTVENLIYAALIGSANNAVESLVRLSGLKRDEFINRMNTSVKEWGAKTTHFIEPTGLSFKNVSSPLDYAIITKEVYTHPILQKISTTPEYSFATINTKKKHKIRNTNYFLNNGNSLNISGSKTGYLNEAGYCLMLRAKAGPDNLTAVIMGANTREKSFLEAEELLRYGLKIKQ
jgi:D-alanyl-D-alanine endopeptidase (penicillin-binding protein 7)